MKRRNFLRLLAAAPMRTWWADELLRDLHTYGMAVSRTTYEPGSGRVLRERLNPDAFRRALEPGLTKMFDEAYAGHEAEWAKLFK